MTNGQANQEMVELMETVTATLTTLQDCIRSAHFVQMVAAA